MAAFKERRDRRRELHRTRTATAIKIFDTIEQHLGKPYKLKWTAAAELDQGGKLTVAMPEGWKLGEKATNGDSAVVRLVPPGKQHIVAVLGRSVKQEGVGAHYQNWFADMARSNHMTLGKHGKLRANGRDWYVYAAFMVPHKKQHDPLARRLLVLALHPLNGAGTEWRSLTVMCPEQNCADNHIAEIIRGILEKLEFEPAAKKGG